MFLNERHLIYVMAKEKMLVEMVKALAVRVVSKFPLSGMAGEHRVLQDWLHRNRRAHVDGFKGNRRNSR